MRLREIAIFVGVSIFIVFSKAAIWGEEERPAEEKPAFELPEVVIIGEDQSKVVIGGERKALIDEPFLKKEELGWEPMGKLFPPLYLPQKKYLNITEFSFAYGRFNWLKSNLTHGRQLRDRAYYLLGITKDKIDGEFPGRRYNEDSGFLELGLKPREKIDLKMVATGLFKDYRLSNSAETQKVDKLNLELGVESTIGQKASLGCQFFGQIANLKNSSKARSEIGGAGLEVRFSLAEKNSLNLEAKLYQERLRLGSEGRRYFISSFSLVDEFLLFDRLWVDLGLGYRDKSKPSTSFLYPMARFSYELVPNFNLWVRYRPDLTIPSFDELYIDNDYLGVNLDLLPQKRRFALEEGMEYKFTENLSGSISFYQRKFANFISFSDDGTRGHLDNIPNVYSEGIETSFAYAIGENFVQDLRYVYEETENEDEPDEKVPYRPCHSLRSSSQYAYGPLSMELLISMRSRRYYDRSHSLPFYWTLGTGISYSIAKEFLIFIQGENLLQEKYSERFGYPLDHIKFLGGFKAKW